MIILSIALIMLALLSSLVIAVLGAPAQESHYAFDDCFEPGRVSFQIRTLDSEKINGFLKEIGLPDRVQPALISEISISITRIGVQTKETKVAGQAELEKIREQLLLQPNFIASATLSTPGTSSKLILSLSPGISWEAYSEFSKELQEKYSDNLSEFYLVLYPSYDNQPNFRPNSQTVSVSAKPGQEKEMAGMLTQFKGNGVVTVVDSGLCVVPL